MTANKTWLQCRYKSVKCIWYIASQLTTFNNHLTFDGGVCEVLFREDGLPAKVPLGHLVIVGHVAEPGTQHLEPAPEERLVKQGHQVAQRDHLSPWDHPIQWLCNKDKKCDVIGKKVPYGGTNCHPVFIINCDSIMPSVWFSIAVKVDFMPESFRFWRKHETLCMKSLIPIV